MFAQTFGRLRAESENRSSVRFERVYDYRPEEVWAAITEPEQLRGWLGTAELDIAEGGGGTVAFGPEETATLRVRSVELGRFVEYDWSFPDEPDSVLRLELEAHGEGTLLVLDHRRLADDDVVDYSAGWHAHLDWLDAHLRQADFEFWPRFHELHPAYAELAGSARPS
jgi:uncharacterized protein YndB with AHSA1/START domain